MRLGHTVTVIAKQTDHQASTERIDGVHVFRIPCNSRIETELFFWRASSIAKKLNVQIFHVFWRFGAALIPIMLGRHRCLLDIRSGSIDNRAWRRKFENILLRLDRTTYRFVTTLDAPLAHHLGVNVTGFVPEGIPELFLADHSKEDRVLIRNEQGWKENEIVGIYIGTSYLRRLDIFFQGWIEYTKHNPTARLIVIGDSINNSTLRNLAKKSSGRIELRPGVQPQEVSRLLHGVDFGVAFVPNTPGFAYQQSTKILEYLAKELPVLATDTPANKALIQEEINGIVIQDSLHQIITGLVKFFQWLPKYQQDDSLHQVLINKYSWTNIVKSNLLPIYDNML